MKPANEMLEQEIIRAPAHVVRTESLICGAVRQFQLERHPQLSAEQVDFLCAPWVHFFTHSALHRLESSGHAAHGRAATMPGADLASDFPVPGDTLAFMEFFRTPAYRSYLDETLAGRPARPQARTTLHILREQLPRHVRTVAFMSCLPRNFRYLLPVISGGRIRFLENKPAAVEIATDVAARTQLGTCVHAALEEHGPESAAWLAARVAELFPKSLLENLDSNLRHKQAGHARRTLFSADGWQIIDDWKIYALAQKIAHGARWIGAPNAISHGSLAVFWQREFETSHMDTYLTWGWERPAPGGKQVTPFYSPHFAGQRLAARARGADRRGVLISAAARPQHLLEYPYTPDRFERYLATQLKLAQAVHEQARMPVTIRTRPRDLGWDVQAMVHALGVPQVTLEFQQGKFTERLAQCRLHICDNCSTTIAESLWANHPTLVLITADYFQIRPEAAEEYDALARAGIFHTNTASLLKQLEGLEGDRLNAWWVADATQQAVRRFLARQGRTGSGLGDWKKALLN